MSSIDNFLSEVYSEEIFSVSESDYDEVMAAPAVDDDWQGYPEWLESLESPEGDLENLEIVNGSVRYKGEGQKRGPFVGGIEV